MGTMSSIRKGAQRFMKGAVIILVVVMAAGVFYIGGGNRAQGGTASVYKGPSASVDGVKIKDKDFNTLLQQKRTEFAQWGGAAPEELIRDLTLEDAINQQIMKNAQNKMGIRVSRSELSKFMDTLHKRFPTEEEWTQLIYQSGAGTERELKVQVSEFLTFQKFILKLAADEKVSVPDADVAKAYESVETSHILFRVKTDSDTEGHPDAEALRLANDARAKLVAGTDFATLAKEKSEDPGSKENGGSLGYVQRGQMVSEFESAAFGMKVGEISQPVKTSFGYHIIKVTARRDAKGADYEEARKDIHDQLLMQKYQSEKFNDWIAKQKKSAKVVVLDPALRGYRLKTEQKWKEAAAAYEKAVKRDKKNLDLHLALAEVYRQDKQFQKAVDALEKTRKAWPTELRVVFSQAESYAGLKNTDKVHELLALASKQAGNDVSLHQEIKRLYELAGMTKQAADEQQVIDRIVASQQAAEEKAAEEKAQEEGGTESSDTAPETSQP